MATKFATSEAITSPTPKWANYIFRTTIVLTTALSMWVAGTELVDPAAKTELILGAKILDFITWGVGRLFGVVKEGNNG